MNECSRKTFCAFKRCLIGMLLWRVFVNFKSIARSFNLRPHAVVYGPMGFWTRSWMSKRKSRLGLQAWQMSSLDCEESSQHGSSRCSKQVHHLYHRHPWQHLPSSSSSPHHPVQLLLSQSSQPQCQETLLWHLHHGMHRFQAEWELIHGLKARQQQRQW